MSKPHLAQTAMMLNAASIMAGVAGAPLLQGVAQSLPEDVPSKFTSIMPNRRPQGEVWGEGGMVDLEAGPKLITTGGRARTRLQCEAQTEMGNAMKSMRIEDQAASIPCMTRGT